jgi:hypothetical protein
MTRRIPSRNKSPFRACTAVAILVTLVGGASAGPYPEPAGNPERRKLDRLASEIEGFMVYSRRPRKVDGESVWMIDKLQIGEWRAETITEGVCARWSQDGRHLAVFRNAKGEPQDGVVGTIFLVKPDGSGVRELCHGVASMGVRGTCPLDFHPDNRHVVFIQKGGTIASVDIQSGEVRDLGLPGRFNRELQLTGDGKYLVARRQGRGDWATIRRLVVINLNDKIHRTFAAGCCAGISPDGNWMTTNHDGHYKMSIINQDIGSRVIFWSRGMIHPQHGWHNWHWSNHNDYIAMKSEVYRKMKREYRGPADAFIIKFSTGGATRVTFEQEANFPDLFVSQDRRTRRPVPPGGGRSIPKRKVKLHDYSLAKIFRTHGETRSDPGPPGRIARIVLEAKLETKTPLDPETARRYGDCLVEHVYTPQRVIRGELDEESIVVVHWAVRRGKVVALTHKLQAGETYRLILENWYRHPELKVVPRKSVYREDDPYPARFYGVLEKR